MSLFEDYQSEILSVFAAGGPREVALRDECKKLPLLAALSKELDYRPPQRRGLPVRVEQFHPGVEEIAVQKADDELQKRLSARRAELSAEADRLRREPEAYDALSDLGQVSDSLRRLEAVMFVLGTDSDGETGETKAVHTANPGALTSPEIDSLREWLDRLRRKRERIGRALDTEGDGLRVAGGRDPLWHELAAIMVAISDASENLGLVNEGYRARRPHEVNRLREQPAEKPAAGEAPRYRKRVVDGEGERLKTF